MKSVTIKTPEGEKLIKVYRTKGGYIVESKSVITDFDCLIVADDNKRVTISVRKKKIRR